MEAERRIDSLDEPSESVDAEVKTEDFVSGERVKAPVVEEAPKTQRAGNDGVQEEKLPSVYGTVPPGENVEEILQRDPVTGQETTQFIAQGTMPVKKHLGAPFDHSILLKDEGEEEEPATQRTAA